MGRRHPAERPISGRPEEAFDHHVLDRGHRPPASVRPSERPLMRVRLRRRTSSAVRWIARRFGAKREAALLAVAADSRAFIAGRHPPGPPPPERRTDGDLRDAYHAIEGALEAGDLDVALASVRRLSAEHPTNPRVLRLRLQVEERRGELTGQVRTLHRLHLLDGEPRSRRAERQVLGRIIETTPGWRPRIPGPPRPVAPRDHVVLHLLAGSRPYVTDGASIRSWYNLLASQGAGIAPEVVTSLGFPRLDGIDDVPQADVVDGIPHHRLDLGARYSLARPVDELVTHQAWLTARVARRVQPSVIHASSGPRGYETAAVGAALRDHIRRPLVYEVRSCFEGTGGEEEARRHATETAAMRGADHVITLSEALRADIVARGIDPDAITLVPNGVDPETFTPRPPSEVVRSRFNLADRFVFGTVGTLNDGPDNEQLLLEATAILARRRRAVTCLIVGDGVRRANLEALAGRLGLTARVAFTGAVPHEEVADYYSVLDAFVAPRRNEPAERSAPPLAPLEAMAMARATVMADVPAFAEIAGDSRGLTFPAEDAAALAAALEHLIDDRGHARRLGEAGREWVVRERDWRGNGERLRAVYERVLAEWDKGRAD